MTIDLLSGNDTAIMSGDAKKVTIEEDLSCSDRYFMEVDLPLSKWKIKGRTYID